MPLEAIPMNQIRRALRLSPARAEMRALGIKPHLPLAGAALILFGCAEVVVTVASLAAL